MSRKLLAAGLFVLACTVTLYANAAADEAPAPRAVEGEKKVEGKGKFGGFGGGKFDPEKLKEMKGKFGKEGGFPFPGGGKGGFPFPGGGEKGKGGFEKGKGGFPFPGGGERGKGGGKGKKGEGKEE